MLFTALCRPANGEKRSLLVLSIVMANVPDLDFLPGLLLGSPALYHRGVTHSVGVALLVSVVVAWVFSFRGQSFRTALWLGVMAYLSHLLIDFFGPDGRWPYGQPVLWPISQGYFSSPRPLLLGMHHASSTYASRLDWIGGILSLYNLVAVAIEVVFIVPFLVLVRWLRQHSLPHLRTARKVAGRLRHCQRITPQAAIEHLSHVSRAVAAMRDQYRVKR
jgi:inner membrane protein